MEQGGRTIGMASRLREWSRYWRLALPLLFVVVVYLFFPYRERFQFNPDEGGEAMKTMLVVRGYPLYDQVWSDQPPVLTFLLATCLRIFGPDVNAGRTLILLLSAALMAAAVQFLRSNWGGTRSLSPYGSSGCLSITR